MKKWPLDIDFRPKYLFSSGLLLIMAGVLELIRPQQKTRYQDMKAMELEAAKEILAEVFRVRLSEIDEMIRCRFEAEDIGSMGSEVYGLWPQEFCLEG